MWKFKQIESTETIFYPNLLLETKAIFLFFFFFRKILTFIV